MSDVRVLNTLSQDRIIRLLCMRLRTRLCLRIAGCNRATVLRCNVLMRSFVSFEVDVAHWNLLDYLPINAIPRLSTRQDCNTSHAFCQRSPFRAVFSRFAIMLAYDEIA